MITITDKQIDNICEYLKKGHALKTACEISGVAYTTIQSRLKSDNVEHEELRCRLSRARAESVDYWINALRDESCDKGSQPRVKAAEFMLGAMDPGTYRDRQQVSPSVIVQVIQGASAPGVKVIMGQVVEQVIDNNSDNPMELPEHTVNAE